MTKISATQAQNHMNQLIDKIAESHQPIVITGKRNKAVLVSEEDWSSIQETLFLSSIPEIRKSIRDGVNIPPEQCDDKLEW